jgi:hypothetical protein
MYFASNVLFNWYKYQVLVQVFNANFSYYRTVYYSAVYKSYCTAVYKYPATGSIHECKYSVQVRVQYPLRVKITMKIFSNGSIVLRFSCNLDSWDYLTTQLLVRFNRSTNKTSIFFFKSFVWYKYSWRMTHFWCLQLTVGLFVEN